MSGYPCSMPPKVHHALKEPRCTALRAIRGVKIKRGRAREGQRLERVANTIIFFNNNYYSYTDWYIIITIVQTLASFPGLSREGKAWGLLRTHARKIPFIFRIIPRKISDNDVIVHGESARQRGKSMRTH